MGGSFAYATSNTVATAEIANDTRFTGDADVTIRSETGSGEDGYETAYARAFAASGGLLAGFAGSEANATNNAESIAKIGNNVYIPNGTSVFWPVILVFKLLMQMVTLLDWLLAVIKLV